MKITKSQLISKPVNRKPHVVILGAGASIAAFPEGDANGKILPDMNNLIEVVGLKAVLDRAGVEYQGQNFETVYSELYQAKPESPVIKEIERIVYDYFDRLRLPEFPTLYDYLLLALRPKDIVATFNWDPFLFEAWNRNKNKVPVPEIVHLHGNVRTAHCLKHPTVGEHGMICPQCNQDLKPTRLLYPVTMKNYGNDIFIKTEWEVLKNGLRRAMTLTIFGWGAPATDKEAVDIMNSAWDKDNRLIERTEIIDIKDKEVLWAQWKPFTIRTYLDCPENFFQSRIATFPRRTCEMLISTTLYGQFVENNPLPRYVDFDELVSWLDPLIEAEKTQKNDEKQG